MAGEFTPLPSEQGYKYGSILPLAQRPIPYANALQPQLAVPGMIREPVNAIASMLQIPGQAARGELGQQPEELMAPANRFAEGAMTAGLAGSSLAGVPENSLGAMMGYHGTPHRFEPVEHNPFGEFKNEAIGSGEGAQVYGHGHYVAGAKEVAEQYRHKLSKGGEGSLYHVEIKPEEHELLDWHKPMSEQTASIRDKIAKILPEHLKPGVEPSSGYRFADQTGKALYQSLAIQTPGKMYDDQAASAALHEAGIPGIKYLDQFSRDAPAGQPKTSNYVIFHPSNLKIRGRNGEMLQLQELSSEEAGGRINRALQNIHASEAAELGYGRRDTTAISPAQQQIDQLMRQHTVEAVDYDPFAVAKFVKEGGT